MELGLVLGFGFWIKSGAAEAHDRRISPTVCAQTRTPTAKEDNRRRPTHSPQATRTHTQSLFSLWLTRTDQQRRQEMQTGGVRLEISVSKSLLFMEGWTAHCTHAHCTLHTAQQLSGEFKKRFIAVKSVIHIHLARQFPPRRRSFFVCTSHFTYVQQVGHGKTLSLSLCRQNFKTRAGQSFWLLGHRGL